jgi:hypothetical protein
MERNFKPKFVPNCAMLKGNYCLATNRPKSTPWAMANTNWPSGPNGLANTKFTSIVRVGILIFEIFKLNCLLSELVVPTAYPLLAIAENGGAKVAAAEDITDGIPRSGHNGHHPMEEEGQHYIRDIDLSKVEGEMDFN